MMHPHQQNQLQQPHQENQLQQHLRVTMAPQWLCPPPAYQSPELKDLVANYFPAIVPTHLYSAQDYRRDPVNNCRGAIEMKAAFEFPLHRVDETNDLGFVLVVDNLWPDMHNSWFDVSKDMRSN